MVHRQSKRPVKWGIGRLIEETHHNANVDRLQRLLIVLGTPWQKRNLLNFEFRGKSITLQKRIPIERRIGEPCCGMSPASADNVGSACADVQREPISDQSNSL